MEELELDLDEVEAQLPGLEEEVDRDLDRPSFSFTRVENELLPLLLRPLLLLLLLLLDLLQPL